MEGSARGRRSPSPAATGMSHLARPRSPAAPGRGVARASHPRWWMRIAGTALAAAASGGCLLPGPPELQAERRVPPIIDPDQVLPNPRQVQIVYSDVTVHFLVEVRANEADGELLALLYRNYGLPDQKWSGWYKFSPPSGLSDEPRQIDLAYTFNEEEDGCYQFSLLVTHLDNVDGEARVTDFSDVAVMTWWFSVEDDEIPNLITDCPFPGGGEE